MKGLVETKEITIKTRVYSVDFTEDEWEAIRYALRKQVDPMASRRATRGEQTPTKDMRKVLRDMDDLEASVSPVKAVPEEDDEVEESDEEDDD